VGAKSVAGNVLAKASAKTTSAGHAVAAWQKRRPPTSPAAKNANYALFALGAQVLILIRVQTGTQSLGEQNLIKRQIFECCVLGMRWLFLFEVILSCSWRGEVCFSLIFLSASLEWWHANFLCFWRTNFSVQSSSPLWKYSVWFYWSPWEHAKSIQAFNILMKHFYIFIKATLHQICSKDLRPSDHTIKFKDANLCTY